MTASVKGLFLEQGMPNGWKILFLSVWFEAKHVSSHAPVSSPLCCGLGCLSMCSVWVCVSLNCLQTSCRMETLTLRRSSRRPRVRSFLRTPWQEKITGSLTNTYTDQHWFIFRVCVGISHCYHAKQYHLWLSVCYCQWQCHVSQTHPCFMTLKLSPKKYMKLGCGVAVFMWSPANMSQCFSMHCTSIIQNRIGVKGYSIEENRISLFLYSPQIYLLNVLLFILIAVPQKLRRSPLECPIYLKKRDLLLYSNDLCPNRA